MRRYCRRADLVFMYVGRCDLRGEEKKVPTKTIQPGFRKEPKKKGQPEFATLVIPGTGRDEKGTPISKTSIHIGAPLGAGSLCVTLREPAPTLVQW
jgi:hypothetical protein